MHRPRRRPRLRRFWLLGSRNVRGDFRSRNGRCGSLGLELRNALLQLLHALEQNPDLLRLIGRRGLCPGGTCCENHHYCKDRQSSAHGSRLYHFLGSFFEAKNSSHLKYGARLPSLLRQTVASDSRARFTLECAGEWSVFYASRLDCQTKLFLQG